MATLQIRKKTTKVWEHVISDGDTFILSKMYCKTDGDTFKIVEHSGSNRREYNYNNITVYDDTDAGTPETFITSQALMLRLSALNYVGFNGEGTLPTSYIQDITAGTNVTIDKTNPLIPVISASGGGGGTLQEVTDLGASTTNAITVQGVIISGDITLGVTNIGNGAGLSNTGAGVTNIGNSAGLSNTGNNTSNIGQGAGALNTGTLVTNIGISAGESNTLDNVINLGISAQATATNQLALNTGIANTAINLPTSTTELTLRASASVETIAYLSDISGGGGTTDLSYTPSPTDGTVTSSTGTDATIPLVDGTNAGLISPTQFSSKQDVLTASNTHTFVDSLTAMTTPVDADKMTIVDNSVSLAKKITWANVKATLKTYFDNLYAQKVTTTQVIINDSTNSSNVTGVVTEVIAKNYEIPANSFSSTDFFKIKASFVKDNVNGASNVRIKASNTNNFATSTVIAFISNSIFGSNTRRIGIRRDFHKFSSGNLVGFSFVSSAVNDETPTTAFANTTMILDPTQTIYLWVTIQNVSTGDGTICNAFQLTN